MIVMLETIRFLYGYVRWADGRMFEAVGKLSPEPWTKDLGSSHKSVRDTAVHVIGGQWMWLSRWKGTSPTAMWDPAEYPSPAPLRAKWEGLSAEIADFAAAQTQATLARDVTYTNTQGKTFTYPLGPLMLHLVNHSTYHRGQVTTLLRQLGAAPVSTDVTAYLAEGPRPK